MGESAVARARCQIEVQPGDILGDESTQKACSQNMIALTIGRALQNVRDAAFQIRIEVGVHGKTPDPFAAARACGFDQIAGLGPVGEGAAVALRERMHARTRERCIVDDRARLSGRREAERIRQNHAALGVGVDHLNGRAIVGAHYVLRFVGERADAIFGDRQPAIDRQRRAQCMQSVEAPHRNGAAFHVGVHVQHALVGFQVRAAGIETYSLAHQAQCGCGGAARSIG